jgi:hypothetical protein
MTVLIVQSHSDETTAFLVDMETARAADTAVDARLAADSCEFHAVRLKKYIHGMAVPYGGPVMRYVKKSRWFDNHMM